MNVKPSPPLEDPFKSSGSSPPVVNPPVPAAVLPEERLWTVKDAAYYLASSESFVYKAVQAGRLPCLRIGAMVRLLPEQVHAFAVAAVGPGHLGGANG